MIRAALSFFVSGLVLALGAFVAWQEARNHARAAELDRLQTQAEWYERECTELRAELVRCAFECDSGMEQTAPRRASAVHATLERGHE